MLQNIRQEPAAGMSFDDNYITKYNPVRDFLLSILILTFTGISCESDHKNPVGVPSGIYSGTFQRQLAFGGGEISNVSITFSGNTWTGQSDRPKYPALCNGTFSTDKNKIIFTNDCAWTADFDWSLILGGEYYFTINGNELSITKSYQGSATDTWTDKYILTKQ